MTSVVNDITIPPIGLALGNIDFANLFTVIKEGAPASPYDTLEAAQAAGAVTINYGRFINTIIIFLIITFVVFFFIVRPIAKMHARKEVAPAAPTTKECPYCFSTININAKRCPNCTSQLQ